MAVGSACSSILYENWPRGVCHGKDKDENMAQNTSGQ